MMTEKEFEDAMEWGNKFESLKKIKEEYAYRFNCNRGSSDHRDNIPPGVSYRRLNTKPLDVNKSHMNDDGECMNSTHEFLDGFLNLLSGEKNKWETKMDVDVSEELNVLLQTYTDAEIHLKTKEEEALRVLNGHMARYLVLQKKREDMSIALSNLKEKMNLSDECDECGEE